LIDGHANCGVGDIVVINDIGVVIQLLVEHVDVVAPDPQDILHELLDDLGEVRDVDFLIGNVIVPFSLVLQMTMVMMMVIILIICCYYDDDDVNY